MRNLLTIFKRELRAYYDSPVAYIVLVAFLVVAGWMFFGPLFLMGRAEMRSFFAPGVFSPAALLVILIPALTMGLVAEERKTGTIELLTTMPITDWQVVLGKFFAALALVASALVGTFVFAWSVSSLGAMDWGPVVSGYFGMLLFSAAMLAIGLACSCMTKDQIVAFIVSFVICAALYYVYWLQFFVPSSIAGFVETVSLSYHLD